MHFDNDRVNTMKPLLNVRRSPGKSTGAIGFRRKVKETSRVVIIAMFVLLWLVSSHEASA